MKTYHKAFAVHNTLVTYEIWEKHQTEGWKKMFGKGVPPAIFDVKKGIADVYYHDVFGTFRRLMEIEHKKDARFFGKTMDWYEELLASIQSRLEKGEVFSNTKALAAFAKQFQDAWIGLDISYMPDYVALDAASERRSAAVRERAFGFYIGADRLIRLSLEKLLPDLGLLSCYVTLTELTTEKISSRSTLEKRAEHFIYYRGEVMTDTSLQDFCRRRSIRLESMYAPLRKEICGLVASTGKTMGTAFILQPGSDRGGFRDGDILVAPDLTLTDVSLVERSCGIVLDAGSYYGCVGVAARMLKKPCVFGTKIATMVLQNGDRLKVDGKEGSVKLV